MSPVGVSKVVFFQVVFFFSGNSAVVENFVVAVFSERKSVVKQGRKFVRFFFLRGHWKTGSRLKSWC